MPNFTKGRPAARRSSGRSGRLGDARVRLRQKLSEPLTRTSVGLIASTVLSALMGVGFWTLAARTFSVDALGRDGVLIAALLALSGIGQLNLGNVFVRFLPDIRKRRGRYVMAGYASASLVSLGLGVLFVLVAPLVSHRFAFITDDMAVWLVFPIAVAAWSIFSLQDAVLIALGRATWLPIENVLFSAARILMLPVSLALASGHGVLLAYVVPMFLAVPIANWFIAKRAMPSASGHGARSESTIEVKSRRFITFLAKDFVGTVLAQVTITALPLLVVAILGAEQSAYFLIPFMLITTFDALFLSVAVSLTTEAARAPARARELTKRSIRWLLAIQLPIAAIIFVAAPLILSPYGAPYVDNGVTVLRVLAIASPFRSVVFLYGAVARLQGHGGRLLGLQFAAAVSIVGGVALLAHPLGLAGVSLAWLATWGVLAPAVAISLYRFTQSARVWGAADAHDEPARAPSAERRPNHIIPDARLTQAGIRSLGPPPVDAMSAPYRRLPRPDGVN